MDGIIEFFKNNEEYLIALAVLIANFILANYTEITPETPTWKRILIKISNWVALNWSDKAGK